MRPTRIELTLPVPPSLNRSWRNGRGRTYKSAEARSYPLAVLAAWKSANLPMVPFPARVPVKYTLTWYRFPAAGDLDNRVKLVADALNKVAWADDKQVTEFHAYRKDVRRGEQRITITIEEAE